MFTFVGLPVAVNGIPWPFAHWEDGKFNSAAKGDSASLAILRRDLDNIDEQVLLRDSNKAGISLKVIAAYKAANPQAFAKDSKGALVDLLVKTARDEKKGWGPFAIPTNGVRATFAQKEIRIKQMRDADRALREKEAVLEERARADRFAMHALVTHAM